MDMPASAAAASSAEEEQEGVGRRASIGVSVTVLPQLKEWSALRAGIGPSKDDSSTDASDKEEEDAGFGRRKSRRANTDAYNTREHRLDMRIKTMQTDQPLSCWDRETPVMILQKEWADAPAVESSSSSDEEGQAVCKRVSSAMSKQQTIREKRLLAGAKVLAEQDILGDEDVQVRNQNQDWAVAEALSSHDEATDVKRKVRAMSDAYSARERRISCVQKILSKEQTIADQDIEVVKESKEWAGDEASEEGEESETKLATDPAGSKSSPPPRGGDEARMVIRQASMELRDLRISRGCEALEKENRVADVEVEVLVQESQWKALEGLKDFEKDAGDAETAEEEAEAIKRHCSEAWEARERRLTAASEVMKSEQSMGDADILVKTSPTEWKNYAESENSDGISDDEEEVVAKAQERMSQRMSVRNTEQYNAREQRILRAQATLKSEEIKGDGEIEVLKRHTEWASAPPDSDDEVLDSVRIRRVATDGHLIRERRLGRIEQKLRDDRPIGDHEVVVKHSIKEWTGRGSLSDSEKENDHMCRTLTKRDEEDKVKAREERIRMSMEALSNSRLLGDHEVQLISQNGEWAHKDADSDDDRGNPMAIRAQKSLTQTACYQARERRLTCGVEALSQERPLADGEVDVVGVRKEWSCAPPDSGDEDEKDATLMRRASDQFEARERRLSAAEVALVTQIPIGDNDVEVVKQEEWVQDLAESDEEDGSASVAMRVATFQNREARLNLGRQIEQQWDSVLSRSSNDAFPMPARGEGGGRCTDDCTIS